MVLSGFVARALSPQQITCNRSLIECATSRYIHEELMNPNY